MRGKVKFFDVRKGWGFIIPDDGSRNIFVHFSAIQGDGSGRKNLQGDDVVDFEIIQARKGIQAVNVRTVRIL